MSTLIGLGYIGLFIAAFLAATVLPFSSEVVYSGVVLAGLDLWTCTIVATIGNFLGGLTCYYVGMQGKTEWMEKYLKIKEETILKMIHSLKGKGAWIAFFVFLPGVGDIIAVAMGYMRANIWIVSISMFLGKLIRYIIWMEMVYSVIGLF